MMQFRTKFVKITLYGTTGSSIDNNLTGHLRKLTNAKDCYSNLETGQHHFVIFNG